MLATLLERARAGGRPDPELRARTAFGLIAELSSITGYEVENARQHAPMLRHLLAIALAELT